ncbi:MAG: hypothetical protein CUN56_02865 [Phototrophicales bacterium]|nr:MAG: hypothetical protein CUN56_02865 [Phototrophicales bacterium]
MKVRSVELLIILLLMIINGVLAMSEAAVIAARKARLQQRADSGSHVAKIALELKDAPGRFLSTVQIGITLVGILAGAFGGATVADDLAQWIRQIDALAASADVLSVAVVVILTTYFSLVIGELVPKRLAIQSPERIAMLIAPLMQRLAFWAYPLVWLLEVSTEAVLTLFGVRPSNDPPVTEEEIQVMLHQGARVGVFEQHEQEMIAGVFRLDDIPTQALMTPRANVVWLDINADIDTIRQTLVENDFSRFPVCDKTLDNVLGVVRARDLLRQILNSDMPDLQALILPPIFIPENTLAPVALERFRGHKAHFGIVIGEYGEVQGVVTLNDIVEAVVGKIDEPDAVQREDGSWLLDGLMARRAVEDLLGIEALPGEGYTTLAGFMMQELDEIPQLADMVEWDGYIFEVIDMDGKRIDKVLVRKNFDAGSIASQSA